MISRNGNQRRRTLSAIGSIQRAANGECLRSVRETAFRLDFKEARQIRFRQVRYLGLHRQRPTQWQSHHAAALTNAVLIEVIPDLTAHQLPVSGQWIQRERHAEALLDLQDRKSVV